MIDREHMERHSRDVERLTHIAFVNGTAITREQAYLAWSKVSESSAAGWLLLYDNNEWNWSSLSSYLDEPSAEAEAALRDFGNDIDRIIQVARRNGKDLDAREAYDIWQRASRKSWEAIWLQLPSYDEELWNEMQLGLKEVEDA